MLTDPFSEVDCAGAMPIKIHLPTHVHKMDKLSKQALSHTKPSMLLFKYLSCNWYNVLMHGSEPQWILHST